jgi:transcriptional antiterminator RfaH
MCSDRKWYVMQTKPRNEKKVAGQIKSKEIEVFLPIIKQLRFWSDRRKTIETPLFSGYVFVHGDETERVRAIHDTNGALRYIYFQNRPAIITLNEIENIKISLREPDRIQIEEKQIKKGDFVKITRGTLRGMTGYVNEFRGNYKLTVNLSEMSSAFSVILYSSEVEVIGRDRVKN